MVYGERIKQVRELLGWTQTDLASELGVTQSFVAQIENGWSKAPDEFMQRFVFRCGFPLRFFESPLESDFPLGSLLFRARASLTEREQKSIRTHASMAHEILERMLAARALKEIPLRVPNVRKPPEEAAIIARSELGLPPDQPVRHVIHAMESAGILVIGLPKAFVGADAFSVWAPTRAGHRRPIVVMSSDRPADRVRLSAAHELGHLVMHQPLPAAVDIHAEADRFAGAFLLPEESLRQELPKATTLETFLQIKIKWGVSVQAAIVRSYQLGLITQRKYRTLFQSLSARGWRLHEPLSSQVPLEKPRAFRQVAEIIYGRRLDYNKIAEEIHYPEPFIQALLEVHAAHGTVIPPDDPQIRVETRKALLEFARKPQ